MKSTKFLWLGARLKFMRFLIGTVCGGAHTRDRTDHDRNHSLIIRLVS